MLTSNSLRRGLIATTIGLLSLFGCNHSNDTRPTTPPHPPVQKPNFEAPEPEDAPPSAPMPKVEAQEPTTTVSPEKAGLWLMFLRSQIGLSLEQEYKVCSALDAVLSFVETNTQGNWFVCADDETDFTVVVNDDGEVIYLADAEFPFTIKGLAQLLGKPTIKSSEGVVRHEWIVKDGSRERMIGFNTTEDGSFVTVSTKDADFLGLVTPLREEDPKPSTPTLNL